MNKIRRMELFKRQNKRCYYCGKPTRFKQWTVDHVIPKMLGGQNNISNLVGSCKLCNTMKGGKTPDLFYALVHQVFDNHVDRLLRMV